MNADNVDPTAADLVEQARQASAAGDVERALRLLQQARSAAAEWHVPPFLLGAELAQVGRIDEAEAAFAAAVLLAPRFEMARFQLGLLQFSSARVGVALMTWQPLLQATQEPALKLFVEGMAALAADDVAQALERFQAGIVANTSNPALNADMRQLVQRLETVPPESPGDVQTMLQNYQRQGSLH